MRRTLVLGAFAAVMGLGFLSTSEPANARGCGGYVNPFVWGCAPHDNNAMCPYHPNCKKVQQQPQRPVAAPAVRPGTSPAIGSRPLAPPGYGYNPAGQLIACGGGMARYPTR